MSDDERTEATETENPVFRDAGISYLRIPVEDARGTATFYGNVFGWTVNLDRADPGFADGTGHVIGHFVPEGEVAGEAGIRPYVYVDDIDGCLERVAAEGGTLTREPYPEGDLWVALVRDPSGNVIGVWQNGPRD